MNMLEAAEEMPPIAFTIKYDGLRLGEHVIDLASLGESLQGFAKILATAGHFVATGQYVSQYSAQTVTVTTDAQLKPGSIDIVASIQAMCSSNIFSGTAGNILGVVLQRILSRNDRNGNQEEMEHLAKALELALVQNKENADNARRITEQLIKIIDRMSDGLASARRQAVSPIGKSCTEISIFNEKNDKIVTTDLSDKAAWNATDDEQVTKSQYFYGHLTELDKITGNCKLTIDPGERLNGTISDPMLQIPENVYVTAFAKDLRVKVIAKALVDKNGEVQRLFISDAILADTNGQFPPQAT